MNGLGATPPEELFILYSKVHDILREHGLGIHRTFVGEYATSMEMAGASISLREARRRAGGVAGRTGVLTVPASVGRTVSALLLDADALRGLLKKVAKSLERHSEELRELDAKVGDGDLGVTVQLMAKALVEFAASEAETDIGRLLMQCGMAVNRANPSTFGTIVASGFMGAGASVVGKTSWAWTTG